MDILNGELDVASAIIEEQDTNSLVAAAEQGLGATGGDDRQRNADLRIGLNTKHASNEILIGTKNGFRSIRKPFFVLTSLRRCR